MLISSITSIIGGTPRNAFPSDKFYFMIQDNVDASGRVWPRGTLFLYDALGVVGAMPEQTVRQTLIIGAKRATFTHKL